MITMKDIARMAGVSRGTVDRVFNNRGNVKPETEKLIREIIEREKFVPSIAGKSLAAYKREYRIAFIVFDHPSSLFFKDVYSAAKVKAEEMKLSGMNVDFVILREAAIEKIGENLDDLFEQRNNYDGFILPVVSTLFESLVDRLLECGKTVVEYNCKYRLEDIVGYVGCDYIRSGRIAAGLAALCTQGKGKLAVFTVTREIAQSYYERIYGLENEINTKYPGMSINVRLIRDESLGRDFEKELTEILENDQEINVLYAVDPGDYSACRIARDIVKDREFYIITNDLMPGQDVMLKNGIITATVTQQPEIQAIQSLQIIYDYLALQKSPETKIRYTDLQIVIDQSINDVKKKDW